MSEWCVDGGIVRFESGPGWSWKGWDGKLTLACPDRGLAVNGRPVGLAEDVIRLATQLTGKAYTAVGFADTPGSVAAATVLVDSQTLDRATTCASLGVVLAKTEGTFVITCLPSLKAAVPPVPDPVPLKRGRWVIDRPGQTAATSE